VLPLLKRKDRVLQLGCGNSSSPSLHSPSQTDANDSDLMMLIGFSEDIYDHFQGELDIVNNDFSEVVISTMKAKTAGKNMSCTSRTILMSISRNMISRGCDGCDGDDLS